MTFLDSLNIGGSALSSQKLRMNIISQNIANSQTTRTQQGGPYIRKQIVFSEKQPETFREVFSNLEKNNRLTGVEATEVVDDDNPPLLIFDPDHPDSDENGYVLMPNINTTEEMVDMISASRAYEANVTAINAIKLMASKALDIGR